MTLPKDTPGGVKMQHISEDEAGQRIDNYLMRVLKGVPKSLIYRKIRKGEVRVNKKRIKPEYKIQGGDAVRIPPMRVSESDAPVVSTKLDKVANLEKAIVYEDKALLVLNKPSGMAVHGGSGLSFGVIEALRALRPDCRFLELVHRLDRDTSGLLLVAKKRSALRKLHEQLREKTMQKRYVCLVAGTWQDNCKRVKAPLRKNTLKSGERVVRVDENEGKASETRFKILDKYKAYTLVEAFPVTGRTHQIRVHTQYRNCPIIGDDKYGIEKENQRAAAAGCDRLFLHARELVITNPSDDKTLTLTAPLDEKLQAYLNQLEK